MKIIFCVYKDIDEIIYINKLKEKMEKFSNTTYDELL